MLVGIADIFSYCQYHFVFWRKESCSVSCKMDFELEEKITVSVGPMETFL